MESKQDKWHAALQNNFDKDVEDVPQEIWDVVEKQIPQKKTKRKMLFFVFSFVSLCCFIALAIINIVPSNTITTIVNHEPKKSIKTATRNQKLAKNNQIISEKSTYNQKTENALIQITPTVNEDNVSIKNTQENNSQTVDETNNPENTNLNQTFNIDSPKIDSNKRFSNLTFLKPSILLLEFGQLLKLKHKKTNDFSLTAYAGLGLNKRTIKGDFDVENKKSRDIGANSFLAETKQIGIDIEKRVHSCLSIGTGIMWYSSSYSSNWFFRQMYLEPSESSIYLNSPEGRINITDVNFLDNFTNGDTLLYKLRSSFMTSSFSIPIFITADKGLGKFKPFIKTGIYFDVQNKVNTSVQTYQFGQMSYLTNYLEKNHLQASMGGIFSFGLNYSLTKNISISMEERINWAFTPVVNYDGLQLKTKGFYTNFGIKYEFTQPKK